MNKDYIPYEQAFELRKIGYDDECTMYYAPGHPEGFYLVDATPLTNSHWLFTADDQERRKVMCTAPLYQQAFRWFREKFESTIHIYQYQDTQRWDFDVYDNTPEEEDFGNPSYDTYEEAELACLKKLIEIAKNK